MPGSRFGDGSAGRPGVGVGFAVGRGVSPGELAAPQGVEGGVGQVEAAGCVAPLPPHPARIEAARRQTAARISDGPPIVTVYGPAEQILAPGASLQTAAGAGIGDPIEIEINRIGRD